MNGVAQGETHNGPTGRQILFPMLLAALLAYAGLEEGVVPMQMHKNHRLVCVSSSQGRPGPSHRTAEVG